MIRRADTMYLSSEGDLMFLISYYSYFKQTKPGSSLVTTLLWFMRSFTVYRLPLCDLP